MRNSRIDLGQDLRSILILVVILFSASSCGLLAKGKPAPSLIATFEQGKTRYTDVIAQLGNPVSEIAQLDGGKVVSYTYTYVRERDKQMEIHKAPSDKYTPSESTTELIFNPLEILIGSNRPPAIYNSDVISIQKVPETNRESKTVFLDIKNSIRKKVPLTEALIHDLAAKGYIVVNDRSPKLTQS